MNIADVVCALMPEWRPIPRVCLDNVAEYVYPQYMGKRINMAHEVPNMAPPWTDVVFFWTFDKGADSYADTQCLVYVHSWRSEVIGLDGETGDGWMCEAEFYDDDPRWPPSSDMRVYTLNNGNRLREGIGGLGIRLRWEVDATGRFAGWRSGTTDASPKRLERDPKALRWAEQEAFILAVPVMFAMGLANCKNVEVEERHAPAKLAAKQLRKRGVPKLSYKVLTIEPMTRRVRYDSTPDGSRRSLHIMRGHWKDYRTGNGLFGKYHGIYWWEMELRGDKHTGLTLHDYTVGRSDRELRDESQRA